MHMITVAESTTFYIVSVRDGSRISGKGDHINIRSGFALLILYHVS